jgi:hypothetical protein
MNANTHAICPICHSDHTTGSRCDCQQVEIKADLIPEHQLDLLASTVLRATVRAFEDPDVQAEYECWKAERQQRKEMVQ